MIAMAYGNVYVAQVAMGASDMQTVKALLEAEAWPGPSLVIAYSTCIAHGIDMATSMTHQKDAVRSGYWPLYRYNPGEARAARSTSTPSRRRMPLREFACQGGPLRHAGPLRPRGARAAAGDLAQDGRRRALAASTSSWRGWRGPPRTAHAAGRMRPGRRNEEDADDRRPSNHATWGWSCGARWSRRRRR